MSLHPRSSSLELGQQTLTPGEHTGPIRAKPALVSGLFVLLASFMPKGMQAQTMYRCGATYQDRPCAGADGQVVGRGAQPARQEQAMASLDPSCQARGSLAQKLMWEKESGLTLAEQLAKPGADLELATVVYGRRGSSLDVRRSIEADCAKGLERTKQAEALLKAAGRASSGGGGVSPAPVSLPPETGPLQGGAPGAMSARAPHQVCASPDSELGSLAKAQRAGGDGARMEDLATRVRDAQSRKRVAGC